MARSVSLPFSVFSFINLMIRGFLSLRSPQSVCVTVEAADHVSMEIQDFNRTVDMDDDDKNSAPRHCKKVDEFYFVKINKLFKDDPALKASLESERKSKQRMLEERCLYHATYIQSLEERLKLATIEEQGIPSYKKPPAWMITDWHRKLGRYRELLQKHWAESINEDLDDERPDPDLEVVKIREKNPTLFKQLGHSKPNMVEENRALNVIVRLHWRREECDREIREADAKTPRPKDYERGHYWYDGSKFDIKRKLRENLRNVKQLEEKENKSIMLHERARKKIEDLEKRIAPHANVCHTMKQEEENIDERISHMELAIQQQSALYEEYCTLLNNARELASEKDSEALQRLSHKQVDAFMSEWASDETFRANYTRSIQLSLANRGLSNDGRMLDLSEYVI